MAFTVLNVAFPFARVAKDTAGGAEHVLLALDHALVASGHRSMVLAPAGSEVEGHLLEGLPFSRTSSMMKPGLRRTLITPKLSTKFASGT